MRSARFPTMRPVRALALVLGLSALLSTADAGRAAAEEVMSPMTALERAQAGELVLLDIRRPSEWADTGVPAPAHEVTMHHTKGPKGFLKAVLEAVEGNRQRPVALICASGVRSSWASRFLAANGFADVYNVKEGVLGRGGETGWLERGLPVDACESCDGG